MIKKQKNNGYCKVINQQTGRLKLIKHYKDGFLDGKIVYYWDNGQIRVIGQYKNMIRAGIWKTFDSNGELIMEEDYTKNDDILEPKQIILLSI